jgi:hypothetical protein
MIAYLLIACVCYALFAFGFLCIVRAAAIVAPMLPRRSHGSDPALWIQSRREVAGQRNPAVEKVSL